MFCMHSVPVQLRAPASEVANKNTLHYHDSIIESLPTSIRHRQ